jgi:DNA-binding MarR family transcriptional regulator
VAKSTTLLAADLRLAVGRLARRLRQLYVEAGDGVSFLELAVLQRLQRTGPTSPGALAGDEGVTSAAIAPVLNSLERRGLIGRARDPADGRRVVVTLHAAGATALAIRDAASVTRIQTALARLTDDERRTLAAATPLLEKVATHL